MPEQVKDRFEILSLYREDIDNRIQEIEVNPEDDDDPAGTLELLKNLTAEEYELIAGDMADHIYNYLQFNFGEALSDGIEALRKARVEATNEAP